MKFALLLFLVLPIAAIAQEPVLMLPRAHTEYVSFAHFTPDGKKLISGGGDGTVKLWDANNGRLLFDFVVDPEDLWEVQVSPDGSVIAATGTTGPEIYLISVSTGKLLKKLETHSAQVRTLAFSADGKRLLSGSYDRTACLWEFPSGKLLEQIDMGATVVDVNFSPDDKKFIIASLEEVKVFNHKGKLQKQLPVDHYAQEALFSPLGNYIVTCGIDSVKFWSGDSYEFLAGFPGSRQYCGENPNSDPCPTLVTAAFSDDESTAYYSFNYYPAMQKEARLISLKDFSTIARPEFLLGENDAPVFYDNGSRIATISNEELVIISTETGKKLDSRAWEMGNTIYGVAYSPAIGKFCIGNFENELHILSKGSLSKEVTIKGKAQSFESVAFQGNSIRFQTGFSALLDLEAGKIGNIARKTRHPHDDHVLLPDSSYLEIWYNEVTRKAPAKGLVADTLIKTKYWIRQHSLSPDGNTLAIVTGKNSHPSYDKTVQLIDLVARKVVFEITLDQDVYDIHFFADSLLILDMGTKYQVRAQDLRLLKEVDPESWMGWSGREVKSWFYSASEKLLLTAASIRLGEDHYVLLQGWKLPGFQLVKEWKLTGASSPLLALSPDEKEFIVTFINDGEPGLKVYDAKSFLLLDSIATGEFPWELRWSPSSEMFGYGSLKESSIVIRSRRNQNTYTIPSNSTNWTFTLDPNTIFSVKGEEMSAWDLTSSALKYKIFYLDSSDMVIQRPDKYYLATANAARYMYYVLPDLKTIGFDQLDIKYNRPDLVLKTLGSRDTALIGLYEQAYMKRIKKLKVDPLAFTANLSLPEAEFVNRDKITYNQSSGQLTLRIVAREPLGQLSALNIWADDVPLLGISGIDLSGRKIRNFDTTVTIGLIPGVNHLSASVMNSNGIESYRALLEVKYEPKDFISEKLYFIGIGIDHFKQPGHDLAWSVKDIRDLAKELAKKYGDDIIIDTLFDKDVEAGAVAALKQKLMQSHIADRVIIAYSGHGLLDSEYNYYLSAWPVDFNDPANGGIPYSMLENLTEGIPARKKLMLIDACHSGEVDKEDIARYKMMEKELADSGTRSSRKPVASDGRMGLTNSFEMMQQLFVNISRNTGTTIISAAAGTQFAQERANLQNGVFTYSILEYMKTHPSAYLSGLKNHVNRRVPEITHGLQVPTTRSETLTADWKIW